MKDETDIQIKNDILDSVSELMEDAQDFGWASAKGAHGVLLSKMVEGTVS